MHGETFGRRRGERSIHFSDAASTLYYSVPRQVVVYAHRLAVQVVERVCILDIPAVMSLGVILSEGAGGVQI